MKRVKFEWIIIIILVYTFIISAGMPKRVKAEPITYPVIPLDKQVEDEWFDKLRKFIRGQIRIYVEELKNNGRLYAGNIETAYTDGEYAGEDIYGDNYEGTADADTGRVEIEEAESAERPDVAESPEEYDDGGYSEPSEVAWSGEGGLTYLGQFTATAYCPCEICCGEYSSGYTASGTYATEGRTVACNSLPMGTQVMIDGNIYTVEDTGWSPYGENWIDIFFWTHDSALAYGMRTVDVYLVG